MTYALITTRVPRGHRQMSIDAFASATGTHPEMVRRLVTLGLIDARRDLAGELWFSHDEVSALARVQRLRAGFALNYAAVGLVTDLLDRIAVLEAELRLRRSAG